MNSQELECTEKVVSDLMMEIKQLREERDYYKHNYELLHNETSNTNEGGYTDQQFNELANAYTEYGY